MLYFQYAYSLSNDDVVIHFHIVKWTILSIFIQNFMLNLRGTKFRAQSHNKLEEEIVSVSCRGEATTETRWHKLSQLSQIV